MRREEPNTVFVLDRLQETSWADRRYISDLLQLEYFAERGGPKSWMEGMWSHQLYNRYPVETRCIGLEVREQVYTTPLEFRRLLKEHAAAERAKEREWERRHRKDAQREQRREEERRRRWIEMGGRD